MHIADERKPSFVLFFPKIFRAEERLEGSNGFRPERKRMRVWRMKCRFSVKKEEKNFGWNQGPLCTLRTPGRKTCCPLSPFSCGVEVGSSM